MNNAHPTKYRNKGLRNFSDLRAHYMGPRHVERQLTRISGVMAVRTIVHAHGVCVFDLTTAVRFAVELKAVIGLHNRALASFEGIRQC